MENALLRGTIGGFNRKDVMNYLATLSEENERALAGLKQELKEKTAEVESLVSDVAQEKQRADLLASQQKETDQELAALREESRTALESAQMAAQKAELQAEQLKLELEESKAALQVALERVEQAERRCQVLQGEVDAYRSVKEKLSEIELSAYERASRVEEQVQKEAEALQAKAAKNIAGLYRRYEAAAETLRRNKAQVQGELENMQAMLDQLIGSFQAAGADFSALYEEAMAYDPVFLLMKEVKTKAQQEEEEIQEETQETLLEELLEELPTEEE